MSSLRGHVCVCPPAIMPRDDTPKAFGTSTMMAGSDRAESRAQ